MTTKIDFETHAIQARPHYPPVPVGVAIQHDGRKPVYLAWGHPTGNNCTKKEAAFRLKAHWRDELVFHNAKFDLDVAHAHLDLAPPPWHQWHDTMFSAFIWDPNQKRLGLKDLAAEHLDMPPMEQEQLKSWILANVPEARRKPKQWGAYIAHAPGTLVAPYAKGDSLRTGLLHEKFKHVPRQPYDRERKLALVLLEMEREGIPVDVDNLTAQMQHASGCLVRIGDYLRGLLGDIDLDSNDQLADALEKHEYLDEWIMTPPSKTHPTGQRSTSIYNLRQVIKDPELLGALHYRSLLSTQYNTFGLPWLNMAQDTGKLYCQWNQVRQSEERGRGGAIGARTGRLSSSPNMQNIPNTPPGTTTSTKVAASSGKMYVPLRGLQFLDLRSCVAALRGQRLITLDYNQQELRVLAHECGGKMVRAYRTNPELDHHSMATAMINGRLGTRFSRGAIKTTGFGIIYGMGIQRLADSIGCTYEEAREIRTAYKGTFPELVQLDRKLKKYAALEEVAVTWGGRPFLCEPPSHGRTFEYKMLNTLIQGGAADCTKEAMVRYAEDARREGHMLLNVHDELVVKVPTRQAVRELSTLKRVMESVEFEVPMLADGAIGKTWSECK